MRSAKPQNLPRSEARSACEHLRKRERKKRPSWARRVGPSALHRTPQLGSELIGPDCSVHSDWAHVHSMGPNVHPNPQDPSLQRERAISVLCARLESVLA